MEEDVPSASHGPATPQPPSPRLAAWPPPGLERLQGDMWGVVDGLGRGGAIFAIPLLASLTLPQDPWRLGVYGDAWWVVLVTTTVAVFLLMAGYVQLFRMLRRWRAAVARGYRARTVALVLGDRAGDTGFLIQGAREYSLVGEATRRALLDGRLIRAALLVGGGLWLSAGFIAGVVLATRGALAAGGLLLWTGLPPAIALVAVAVLRAWENRVVRGARRAWHTHPWSEDLAQDEIRAWHAAVAARPGAVAIPAGTADGHGGALHGATAGAAVLGVAVVVLAVPLVTTSGIGPALAAISLPRFSSTAQRAARSEALVSLRLPIDPSITPLEAGEAFHSLTRRSGGDDDVLRPPARSYDPIFPNDEYTENPTGLVAHFWARDLVPRLGQGLDAPTVAYLRRIARHPAFREFAVMARAGALDEAGAIYALPLPEDMSSWELPIPRYAGVRELAYAQAGVAVGAAAAGRMDEAETRLRELISAGLLVGRDGSTLISNMIGFVIAGVGAEALANLYDATGRAAEAEALRERMRATERAARLGREGLGPIEISTMPDVVTDTSAIRGIRWEYFAILSTLGPCLNLRRAVFGPPDDYGAWVASVRAGLVRTEGEEEIFRVVQRGWGGDGEGGLQPIAHLFAQVMGSGVGSCAELAATVVE